MELLLVSFLLNKYVMLCYQGSIDPKQEGEWQSFGTMSTAT